MTFSSQLFIRRIPSYSAAFLLFRSMVSFDLQSSGMSLSDTSTGCQLDLWILGFAPKLLVLDLCYLSVHSLNQSSHRMNSVRLPSSAPNQNNTDMLSCYRSSYKFTFFSHFLRLQTTLIAFSSHMASRHTFLPLSPKNRYTLIQSVLQICQYLCLIRSHLIHLIDEYEVGI